MPDPNLIDLALSLVATNLAITKSELLKQIMVLVYSSQKAEAEDVVYTYPTSRSREETATQIADAIKTLVERQFVKVKELGLEGEAIYTITADGVMELERKGKKGIASLVKAQLGRE
jgi:hypothetical protein